MLSGEKCFQDPFIPRRDRLHVAHSSERHAPGRKSLGTHFDWVPGSSRSDLPEDHRAMKTPTLSSMTRLEAGEGSFLSAALLRTLHHQVNG